MVLKLAPHGQSLRLCNLQQQSRDLGGRLGPKHIQKWNLASFSLATDVWVASASRISSAFRDSGSLKNEPLNSRLCLSLLRHRSSPTANCCGPFASNKKNVTKRCQRPLSAALPVLSGLSGSRMVVMACRDRVGFNYEACCKAEPAASCFRAVSCTVD